MSLQGYLCELLVESCPLGAAGEVRGASTCKVLVILNEYIGVLVTESPMNFSVLVFIKQSFQVSPCCRSCKAFIEMLFKECKIFKGGFKYFF